MAKVWNNELPFEDLERRIADAGFTLCKCLSESRGVTTYLGKSNSDGQDVVVKLIFTAAVHAGALMRLEYEATHLQRLRSDALAPILHVGRETGILLLVQRYVPGTSLQDCLRSRRLSLMESVAVGQSLLTALRDLHGHRLLHRSIRPRQSARDG